MSVCLYYIALGKKNVLNALAKMSKSDQSKVICRACVCVCVCE